MNSTLHPMTTKNLVVGSLLGFGLLSHALIAQAGPANGRVNARPDSAPIGNPDECPYFVEGQCPACKLGFPEGCPNAIDGECPCGQVGPNDERPGYEDNPGARPNPDADPKLDGTGGRGKLANPTGPQDGSAPGQGCRGGRG